MNYLLGIGFIAAGCGLLSYLLNSPFAGIAVVLIALGVTFHNNDVSH